MQLILQATHGVVSGQPAFFKRAFGETVDEFEAILLRPHRFIFNREWYERLGGRAEFEEYKAIITKLSASEKSELLSLLSSTDPGRFKKLATLTSNALLKKVFRYYVPLSKEAEALLWTRQKAISRAKENLPPEDELVEDAGLSDDGAYARPGQRNVIEKNRQMVLL